MRAHMDERELKLMVMEPKFFKAEVSECCSVQVSRILACKCEE